MSVATLIEAVAILIRVERFLHPNFCWTIPEVHIHKCVTHCFWGPFSSANMQPKHIALTGISVNDATSLEIFLCNGVKLGFHPSSHQFTDLRK
jgi:hypothetical protein